MNSKLKLPLSIISILLMQSCSWMLDVDPDCWGLEESRTAYCKEERAGRVEATRYCERELPIWENCKLRENAGENVYCGVKPC